MNRGPLRLHGRRPRSIQGDVPFAVYAAAMSCSDSVDSPPATLRRILPLLLLLLPACYRFATVRRQGARIERQIEITGRVHVENWDALTASGEPGQIVVALMQTPRRGPTAVLDIRQLFAPGVFTFRMERGQYLLGAFLDRDEDFHLDDDEWAVGPIPLDARRRPSPILRISEHGEEFVASPIGSTSTNEVVGEIVDRRPYRLGEIISLGDRQHGPESGTYGTWQPVRWASRFPGGVHFVAPHDPDRIPVLFVHGLGGHPAEFAMMADRLDDRFEPWFAQFASGAPLRLTAAWLGRVLDELRTRYGTEHVCMVAHSMGGLIAREAITRQNELSPHRMVRGLVTIASPLGGMPSAAAGARFSPGVVPAWRDLEPIGPFLRDLYRRPLDLPYTLVFAYEGQGCDDSVVSIRSQLRDEAQREATAMRGFQTTHVDALHQPEVWSFVEEALSACVANVPTRPEETQPTPEDDALESPLPSEARLPTEDLSSSENEASSESSPTDAAAASPNEPPTN